MLQGEHSAILLTFIKLPFVMKIFVLSTFEWLFYAGFTVHCIHYGLIRVQSVCFWDFKYMSRCNMQMTFYGQKILAGYGGS